MGSLIAVVGAVLLLSGWFAPELLVPAIAVVFVGALVARSDVRAAIRWPALLTCMTVVAVFAVKDLLTPGPFADVIAGAGLPAGFYSRRPDLPAACGQLAALGACLLLFPVLMAEFSGDRLVLGWTRAVVMVLTGLAAVVLTDPAATKDYGTAFHLGDVVSRNPAAGAFALGAILAAGLTVAAFQQGRTREWPLASVAAVVCAAAVAGLGSRGGVLALLAGAGWFMVGRCGRRVRPILASVVVLVAGLLLVAPATVARMSDFGDEFRLELWAASLRALEHAPLAGLGGGGFQAGFALFGGLVPSEGMRVTHPDSSWVLLLVEWGPLGLLVMIGAGWRLLRSAEPAGKEVLRLAAGAGVVAWTVAAIGDIALHRPALLVIGVPLLAIARPLRANVRHSSGGGRSAMICAGLLALLFAGASLWAEHTKRRPDDPSQVDARLVRVLPLDARVHHVLGRTALERGEPEEAAKHFILVGRLDPANAVALQAYARALQSIRPDLALSLWKRFMDAARLTASSILAAELERPDSPDAIYWMRATESRPELWVVPAAGDRKGAQRCYDRWRREPAAVRRRSPIRHTVSAMARWGTTADLAAWWRTGPDVSLSEVASCAELLRSLGRPDLAWTGLTQAIPVSPPLSGGTEPGLRARVLANPDDYVAAARLLNQTRIPEEKLKLLGQLAARPGSPAWFRIRLARTLHESGKREEALDLLLATARGLGSGK